MRYLQNTDNRFFVIIPLTWAEVKCSVPHHVAWILHTNIKFIPKFGMFHGEVWRRKYNPKDALYIIEVESRLY